MQKFEQYIALRYLKPRKNNIFVTIIGLISIVGVMIGVTVIIITLSMLNGFEREVITRFLGFDSHIKVVARNDNGISDWEDLVDKIRNREDVIGVSPFIVQKGMVSSPSGSHVVFVKGTTEKTLTEVTDISQNMALGEIDFSSANGDLPGILVGATLSQRLIILDNDTVTVLSPVGITSAFSIPRAKKFRANGFFRTQMFEYDDAYVFISLDLAADLFDMGDKINGLEIRLTDIAEAEAVKEELQAALGAQYVVETWFDLHRDLYAAMKLEKWGSLILLSLIIIVAGFNIVSTLIMVVMQKTKEIGILVSMGASSRSIARIFMMQGLVVGAFGIVAGCLIGYTLCFLQQAYGIVPLPSDIFFLDSIPVDVQLVDFICIVAAAVVLCLVSTLYPARKASRLNVIDALRYE